jgi:hypothetical protein
MGVRKGIRVNPVACHHIPASLMPSHTCLAHAFPGGLELEDEEEEGGLGWLHILELARVEGTP